MESSDSSFRSATADVQPKSAQTELLALLQRLVDLIASDAMSNVQDLPEFRTMIGQLCETAPEAAQTFATTIQEFCNGDVPPPGPARRDSGANQSVKRKRTSGKDLSYRPPKPAKKKVEKTNCPDDLGQPEDESEIDIDCSARDLVSDDVQLSVPNAEDITAQGGSVELGVEVPGDGIGSSQEVSQRLDQRKNKEGSIGAAEATSASNEAEKQRANVSSEPMPHTVTPPPAPADMAPRTPLKRMEGELASPPTEEIHREKIPTSLESGSSSPKSITGSSSTEAISLMDMILEAARTIHQFTKYQHEVPREVHKRILKTFQKDHQEVIGASNSRQWSDGSMWIQVLDMGSSANQKATILNMLEYMGAWEWYDRQISLSQETIRTKKNMPVSRRGAAIHVLDSIQDLRTGTKTPGKWISGIGRVALGKGGDESDLPPESCEIGIGELDRQHRRKHIRMQLSRGQKLMKLVKKLGLGILFNSKMWEFIKMDAEKLDAMVRGVEADSKRMQLLHILGRQLEQLINEGHPDLHAFYDALKEEKLVSEEEFQVLHVTFALDGDAIPKDTLNAAVDQLIEDINTRVPSKRKLQDDDSVTLDNGVELSCKIFDNLRQGAWLTNWTIMAAMQISDRPPFVRYGVSLPLDERVEKKNKKKKKKGQKATPVTVMMRIKRPLAGWAQEISRLRQEAKDMCGDAGALVHFRPLNHRQNHFSLLEINDREQKIRHYDSMANKAVIKGETKLTRVGKVVQDEFGHLRYAYSEAPTPQQGDFSSCGVMVVWIYRRLSNNLPIGGWDTQLDPGRMKMEIVNGLLACVEGNAIKRYRETPKPSDSKGRLGKA